MKLTSSCRWFLYIWIAFGLIPVTVFGQTSDRPSPTLDSTFVRDTVESVADKIRHEYFDIDLAARIDSSLRQSLAQGHYANAGTSEDLASLLTGDLYTLSHDKHLSVMVVPPTVDGPYAAVGASPQSREEAVRVSNAGVLRGGDTGRQCGLPQYHGIFPPR